MTTKTEITLPPLPYPQMPGNDYTASDMKTYARAAVEADRQRRGDPIGYIQKDRFDWITAPNRDKTAACVATIEKSASTRCTTPIFSTAQPAASAEPCRAALAELVACKDLKDRRDFTYDSGPRCEFSPKWRADLRALQNEYNTRKPAAWAAARAALAGSTAPVAQEPNTHIDDDAVDHFAVAMKEKLAQARAKGRHGWHECAPADLSAMLRAHVEKGDPRDVANFCMFLWSLGHPISAAPTSPAVEQIICPKCGVDRGNVPCPGDLMNCPIRGEAQAAVEQPSIPETPDSSKSVTSAQDLEDAERWREVAERFDQSKASECERILDALGLDAKDAYKSFDLIIDAARKEQP